MFFSKFPRIDYDGENMTDISISLVIPPSIRDNKDLFFWYQIEDGDTPESVAFDFYGNTHLNFVVLLMNNIVDPFWDWPLSGRELTEYCISKYGEPTISGGKYISDGYFAVKHWIDTAGTIYTVDPDPTPAAAVSFFQYEEDLNTDKRKIKILHEELIRDFRREISYIINKR